MTAGAEKLQASHRWSFELDKGKSKIVPFYYARTDTDGDNLDNEYFSLAGDYPASEILWKSRCSGGYASITAYNKVSNGAKLGLTWLRLNKYNYDIFPTGKIGNKASTLDEILQDTLKDDLDTRMFVPHMREVILQARQTMHEEGNLPTGMGTAPCTTPGLKAIIISNLSTIDDTDISIQIRQDFYQYSPGIATSTRDTSLTAD